jgi:hypothetical protein
VVENSDQDVKGIFVLFLLASQEKKRVFVLHTFYTLEDLKWNYTA